MSQINGFTLVLNLQEEDNPSTKETKAEFLYHPRSVLFQSFYSSMIASVQLGYYLVVVF